jgi:ABC-type Mn2+/Zn2+ transport system ATPase subunit
VSVIRAEIAGTEAQRSPSPAIATVIDDAVRLEDVTAGYGDRVALSHVTLRVPKGSLLAVVGPNGAGKSTLIKVMAGLLKSFSGSVVVLGGEVGEHATRVAYLPQAEAVDWQFPVSVGDVVMMGRYPLIGWARRPGATDREHVARALATVGMEPHADRQIGALSGGQRRRVFLARAIAADPDLYLLDEPVTGVDAVTQEDLMDVLESEARSGKTVIATTHDLLCAAQRFQQAALINGRLVAQGPANLVLDQKVLAETYGGHVLILQADGGSALALDDAHHHDEAAGRERHFHEDGHR